MTCVTDSSRTQRIGDPKVVSNQLHLGAKVDFATVCCWILIAFWLLPFQFVTNTKNRSSITWFPVSQMLVLRIKGKRSKNEHTHFRLDVVSRA